MTQDVGAVMLAAGFSNRFGSIKICAGLTSGRTVFQQTLDNLRPVTSRIVVVTRAEVAPLIATADADSQVFDAAERGMGATLAHGIRIAREKYDLKACLVCLADMPFVTTRTYHSLAAALAEDTIVVPTYLGRPGNPAGFGRAFFDALAELTGDRGGRSVIRANSSLVTSLPVDDPAILQDIDTPDDLTRYDQPS
jgi:molybdenum cofactor cytidylyltransferase